MTAYKEVIRLLENSPTDEHLKMILTEWQRDHLHRDVRIVIINAAVNFLRLPGKRGEPIAWKILESAVRSPHPEIQVSMLGPTPSTEKSLISSLMPEPPEMPEMPEYPDPPILRGSGGRKRKSGSGFDGSGLVSNKRLLEHLESRNLRKYTVPAALCERYVKTIILRLAAPDVDDDVQTLASFCLIDWLQFGVAADAAKLYFAIAADVRRSPVLVNAEPQILAIHQKRWKTAVQHLFKICQITEKNTFNVNNQPAVNLIGLTLDECAKYVTVKTGEDRDARQALFSRANELLTSIPISAVGVRLYFSADDEKRFLEPYRKFAAPKDVFWKALIQRRNSQLNGGRFGERFDSMSIEQALAYGQELIDHLAELFDGAVTGDLMSVPDAIDQATNLIACHCARFTNHKHVPTIQRQILERLLQVTKESYTASQSNSRREAREKHDLNRCASVFRTVTLNALKSLAHQVTDQHLLPQVLQFFKQTIHSFAAKHW